MPWRRALSYGGALYRSRLGPAADFLAGMLPAICASIAILGSSRLLYARDLDTERA
jgi:hypothetical protein